MYNRYHLFSSFSVNPPTDEKAALEKMIQDTEEAVAMEEGVETEEDHPSQEDEPGASGAPTTEPTGPQLDELLGRLPNLMNRKFVDEVGCVVGGCECMYFILLCLYCVQVCVHACYMDIYMYVCISGCHGYM